MPGLFLSFGSGPGFSLAFAAFFHFHPSRRAGPSCPAPSQEIPPCRNPYRPPWRPVPRPSVPPLPPLPSPPFPGPKCASCFSTCPGRNCRPWRTSAACGTRGGMCMCAACWNFPTSAAATAAIAACAMRTGSCPATACRRRSCCGPHRRPWPPGWTRWCFNRARRPVTPFGWRRWFAVSRNASACPERGRAAARMVRPVA